MQSFTTKPKEEKTNRSVKKLVPVPLCVFFGFGSQKKTEKKIVEIVPSSASNVSIVQLSGQNSFRHCVRYVL